ncbi:ABC transporter permease [Cellulosimicrobium arenosum]|uniref:ABC transporter permease n=1 Tax=Cellulosimicrobium arenosum TaxID=2708133 RepID=A0A927J1Q3_9MICO|nr:ABC transporter permease [Cellulosimicrobium arenosum]MBD8080316.1 ABC transporter permease [Cellulosimicrobium arenosum]
MPAPTPMPHTHWSRVVAIGTGLVALASVLVLAFLWPSVTAEPKDLPLAVAGSGDAAQVAQVEAGIAEHAPDAFTFVEVEDRTAAVDAIETREAYGAVVLGAQPEVLTASAASPVVAPMLAGLQPALQAQVDAALAAQAAPADAQVTVGLTDVVPLSADDARGTTMAAASFPLVLGGMIGGIAISTLVVGVWRRVTGLVVYSVAGGTAIAGILHALGGLQGAFWGDAGVVALTLFGIGAVITGAVALLGTRGIAVGPVLFLLVANPLSGAQLPVEFMARPWGEVGQWMPPGASSTLLRDLSYFPRADVALLWSVLAGWAALGLLLSTLGHFKNRGAATAEALHEASEDDEHEVHGRHVAELAGD